MNETSNIRLRDLCVSFGSASILSHAEFSAKAGDTIGLMGRNGSGKSTLLAVLAGLLIPQQGTGSVCGVKLGAGDATACGMMFEHPPFLENRTGFENLSLLASYGRPVDCDVTDLMRAVGLDPQLKTKVKAYSQGMRKRLALAQATMTSPQLLLLDEPMNGLDPEGMVLIRTALHRHRETGGIAVISSHLLDELARLCNRVYLVHNRNLYEVDTASIADGKLEEVYLRSVCA